MGFAGGPGNGSGGQKIFASLSPLRRSGRKGLPQSRGECIPVSFSRAQ